ncbi:hypothetical protein ACLOJK_013360 [Asimina triloba]
MRTYDFRSKDPGKSSNGRTKKTQLPNMESLIAAVSSFFFAKPPLSDASDRYKLLHIARYTLALSLYSIFFFLRILLSRFPPPSSYSSAAARLKNPESQPAQICDSAIARALSQMLAIMNSIHVGSRKYELVRALAERVMDENVREGSADINRVVLSSAFSRTMGRLEEAISARGVAVRSRGGSRELVKLADGQVSRALGAVRKLWVMAGPGAGEGSREGDGGEGAFSAEKLAAELLWLAQKMAESGAAEEAVYRWGSASGLAAMAIGAEPRLQGALVKVSGERTICEVNRANFGRVSERLTRPFAPLECVTEFGAFYEGKDSQKETVNLARPTLGIPRNLLVGQPHHIWDDWPHHIWDDCLCFFIREKPFCIPFPCTRLHLDFGFTASFTWINAPAVSTRWAIRPNTTASYQFGTALSWVERGELDSSFLFKQAKDMEELAAKREDYSSGEPTAAASGRGKKMNMLTSWLPLLCHASNGTDSPVLSSIEKAEMEKVIEEIIEEGLSSSQQEQVLALWLHHFTACSYSDWPNLQACYARWYAASRRTLLE